MSNRIFNQALALEKQIVKLYGYINSIGTAITYGGLGITSVVRNGVGNYTINFDDAYDTFLMLNSVTAHQTSSTVANVIIKTADSSVQSTFKNSKALTIVTHNTSGAAVEPADNSTIYFEVVARRSSSGRTWSF